MTGGDIKFVDGGRRFELNAKAFARAAGGRRRDAGARRLHVFEWVWNLVEERARETRRQFFAPVADSVFEAVSAELFPENRPQPGTGAGLLPVITLNLAFGTDGSTFTDDLCARLSQADAPVYCSRLGASIGVSLKACLQHIVQGFAELIPDSAGVESMGELVEAYEKWTSRSTAPKKRRLQRRRDDDAGLVVLLSAVETMDAAVVGDLLLVLSRFVGRLPLVVVADLTLDAAAFRLSLGQQSLARVRLRPLRAPPAAQLLHAVVRRCLFSEPLSVLISSRLLKLLVGRYDNENFSADQFLASLKLALLDFVVSDAPVDVLLTATEQFDGEQMPADTLEACSALPSLQLLPDKPVVPSSAFVGRLVEQFRSFQSDYVMALRCLLTFLKDLPQPLPQNLCSLYSCLEECEGLFDGTCPLRTCRDIWLTWSRAELLRRLRVATDPQLQSAYSSEAFAEFGVELDAFRERIESSDQSAAAVDEGLAAAVGRASSAAQMGAAELSDRLRQQVRRKHDAQHGERERLVGFLLSSFRHFLAAPTSKPLHEALICGVTDAVRAATTAQTQQALSDALIRPRRYLADDAATCDASAAWRRLCVLQAGAKVVPISRWLDAFADELAIDGARPQTRARFYCAASELELLGCVRVASDRRRHAVVKLYTSVQ